MDKFTGFQNNDLKNFKQEESKFDEEELKTIQETLLFKGDDPYYDKLVERQQKGVVWGLGGELLRQEHRKFNIDEDLNADSIMNFLDMNQIKDIKLVDIQEFDSNYIYRYGIIGSMYSSVHGWKVCKDLSKAFTVHWEKEKQQRKQKYLDIMQNIQQNRSTYGLYKKNEDFKLSLGQGAKPQISGMKDDEWLMVAFQDYMVHLVSEDAREELALEEKWKYSLTEEVEQQMDKFSKGKKALFEPFK